MNVGTEIYYTGDMANQSGFFVITKIEESHAMLKEIETDHVKRRSINTPVWGIGTTYKGHMGTRFVTRQAYNEFRENALSA